MRPAETALTDTSGYTGQRDRVLHVAGIRGRSYPFDGTDPIAYASGGFLWDSALAGNKTVQDLRRIHRDVCRNRHPQRRVLLERWEKGEDFSREWNVMAQIAPINKIMSRIITRSYSTAIPDVIRASFSLRLQEDGSRRQDAESRPHSASFESHERR